MLSVYAVIESQLYIGCEHVAEDTPILAALPGLAGVAVHVKAQSEPEHSETGMIAERQGRYDGAAERLEYDDGEKLGYDDAARIMHVSVMGSGH